MALDSKQSNNYVLLAGRSNLVLAKKVASFLKKELFNPVSVFSDGEIRIKVPENVRRRHVFIIQPTCPPVNDSLMELVFMIDAARRSSADEITAVIPYFGYSRQDRKEMPRVPISASVVASILENAGVNRIVTLDIHSEQQQGFIKGPWDNLYGSYSLIPEIKKRNLKNLVIAAPDKGGMTRATGYARLLGVNEIALVYKERDIAVNNTSNALAMIGNVEGKNILLVDDMIDTGGTVIHAAEYLKKSGAKKVIICATHGLFSGSAPAKFEKSTVDEVIITDTVPLNSEMKKNKRITVVSVADLLASAIERIESGESLSRKLIL
ncbi:MAG: ribose-phosphate pyrophosphokinase [Candidatus Levybacteria bacterium]|nr:ribose-phosphate pyrophosphokinase [Candidatus Levybacteria bacterium]MBP9815390.1 ribose-phosphate pyrophosphokinase [Candidatus Levybacteria bacterium]